MISAAEHIPAIGRLRREYLVQDEARGTSTPVPVRCCLGRHGTGTRGFTLRGHRLSSLYRGSIFGSDG